MAVKKTRLAKIGVVSDPAGYGITRVHWWRMLGGNGEIMFYSEIFTRRTDAKRAMRRAIQIIQSGLFRIEE